MVVNYSVNGTHYEDANARVFTTERPDVFFFEHRDLGDEGFCGSVWLENRRIVDYDGVYSLPKAVSSILKQLNLIDSEDIQ